jgi:hypothetical protein
MPAPYMGMNHGTDMPHIIRQILRNDSEHRWFEITLMSDPVRRFKPFGDSADRPPPDPDSSAYEDDSSEPSQNETIHPDWRRT